MDLFNKKRLAETQVQLENANSEIQTVKAELENASRTLHERDLLANAFGISHGGKRNTNDVYGYQEKPQFSVCYDYVRSSPVAKRIAFGKPHSCWRDGFEVYDSEEKTEDSQILVNELNLIRKKMLGALERADIMNRIGRFSAMFIGIPDGLDPSEPVGSVMGNALKSVYFRPFAYDGIQVSKYDMNIMSPRYGMPEIYQLQVMGRGDTEKTQGLQPIKAHWSRVVHIVENRLDSELEGIPAVENALNRIIDIEKATGGAAEAYFRNARGKFSFEVDPDFSSKLINDPEFKKSYDDAAKRFTNDWQDQIVTVGTEVASHSTPHASPIDTVRVALWSISAEERVPIRLLTGEGSGQMAGSEDKLAYNQVIRDRQESFCDEIARDTLARLDMCGAIELPENYWIAWPEQEATTEAEKAEIGLTKAQALNQLTSAASNIGGDSIPMAEMLKAANLDDVEIDDINLDDLPDIEDDIEGDM